MALLPPHTRKRFASRATAAAPHSRYGGLAATVQALVRWLNVDAELTGPSLVVPPARSTSPLASIATAWHSPCPLPVDAVNVLVAGS